MWGTAIGSAFISIWKRKERKLPGSTGIKVRGGIAGNKRKKKKLPDPTGTGQKAGEIQMVNFVHFPLIALSLSDVFVKRLFEG